MSELRNIIPLTGTIIVSTDSASAAASAAAAAESAASAASAANTVNRAIIDAYDKMCGRSIISGASASGHFVPGYPLDYTAYIETPHAPFSGVNNLSLYRVTDKPIGAAHGSEIESWAQVKEIVRCGLAPRLLPIGTQLSVNHSAHGTRMYDVVAHNCLKGTGDPYANTMTLMQHDLIPLLQYDAPEAFYYADTALPAGTYNFTIETAFRQWTVGTYQFTTTQELPAGGQFAISSDANTALTSLKVQTFASQNVLVKSGEYTITSGNAGTNLGTFGVDLNDAQRVSYGSNNYKESAARQLVTSDAAAGSVWSPQTKFDRPPFWVASTAGFVRGLDADFVDVIGEVALPCSTNSVYESPDSTTTAGGKYTLNDKFYFASRMEILGTQETVADDSVLFQLYEGAAKTDRIKYLNNEAGFWRLRTPNPDFSYSTRRIGTDGLINNNSANYGDAFAPACTIVG